MNTHSFSVELATKLGVEKAIILQHLWFWHQKNKANEQNYHDGSYWTYNTAKAFSEMFPYIKEKKMYSILKSLEDDGFIKTGNYNKVKFDRTKWYALTEKGISIFQNKEMDLQETENPIPEPDEPIPDSKPSSKPGIKPKKPKYELLNIHQRIPDYIYEDYTDEQVKQRNILVAEELLNSTTWMNTVGRLANLQPELINKKVKEFLLKIEAGRECFNTLSEIKRHFSNWIKTNKTINT